MPTNFTSTYLEIEYDKFRKTVESKLKEYKSNNMKISAHWSKADNFQFEIKIKNKKEREKAILALQENKIDFSQNKDTLYTSLSGVSQLIGCFEDTAQKELINIEKKIQKKIKHSCVARITNKKGYKWAVYDEELGNTYYFKSLHDMTKALREGLIKEGYSLFNKSKWSVPMANPKHWEFPNTFRYFTHSDNEYFSMFIDGGDETAIAIKNSGAPDLVAHGIQAACIYPMFLGLIHIGYTGAIGESDEHEEELEENLEIKARLRKLLLESLIREVGIKEQFKHEIESKTPLNPGTSTYQLVSSTSKEAVLQDGIIQLLSKKDVPDSDVTKLETESNNLESSTSQIISKDTLEKLSDFKFYQAIIEKSGYLAHNSLAYAKFIKDLSEWKQAYDETLILKIKTYMGTQLAQTGLSWMWWGIAVYEAAALLSTIQDITGPISKVASSTDYMLTIGDSFIAAGQFVTVFYGLIEVTEGIDSALSFKDWIKKIKESTIIDKDTKELIINYFESRKSHAIIKSIGNSMLTAGQMMMICGGPVGGLGTPLTLPGAALTILGVGVSLASALSESKKFTIDQTPSPEETAILSDNSSKPVRTEPHESTFHSNLRWKANGLKKFSKDHQATLAWITIYSQIMHYCSRHKQPSTPEEKSKALNKIVSNVKQVFKAYKHLDNMFKEVDESLFKQQETFDKISKGIHLFYTNNVEFYTDICDQLAGKNTNRPLVELATKHSTNYKNILDLIDTLKKHNFWSEVKRRLVKKLVIEKKSEKNIRGKHFRSYITPIKTKTHRKFNIPGLLPIVNILKKHFPRFTNWLNNIFNFKFVNGILPLKRKTIYIFNEKKFLDDLKNYASLSNSEKALLDEIVSSLIAERKNPIGISLAKLGTLRAKSDVYRPLWLEIPQLVHQEQLATKNRSDDRIVPVTVAKHTDAEPLMPAI